MTLFRMTAGLTAFSLATAFVVCQVYSATTEDAYKRGLLSLESVVLFIAFAFYLYLLDRNWTSSTRSSLRMRYSDWALTTPLMLAVLCLLYGRKDEHTSLGDGLRDNWDVVVGTAVLTLVMVFFGYVADRKEGCGTRLAWSVPSFLSLLGVFVWIFLRFDIGTTTHPAAFWFTAVVWALYGLLFAVPCFWKTNGVLAEALGYNVLDMVAKTLFALLLATGVFSA